MTEKERLVRLIQETEEDIHEFLTERLEFKKYVHEALSKRHFEGIPFIKEEVVSREKKIDILNDEIELAQMNIRRWEKELLRIDREEKEAESLRRLMEDMED